MNVAVGISCPVEECKILSEQTCCFLVEHPSVLHSKLYVNECTTTVILVVNSVNFIRQFNRMGAAIGAAGRVVGDAALVDNIGYFLDSESIAATCDNADDIANIADADAVLRCQVTTHRAGVRSAIRRYNAHHYGPRNTLVMFYSL